MPFILLQTPKLEKDAKLGCYCTESNLPLCVELGLMYCSSWSPKQNQNSGIDMQSNP